MLEKEAKLVVDIRERRVHDLRGHEVGKHLLQPHIVEPLHRHEIAEPHVGRFVGNEVRPGQELILGRGLVEEERGRVVIDRSRVLHAAELKRRQEYEVEFFKRKFPVGVGFQPIERLLVQIEDDLAIRRYLLGISLAVKEVEHPVAALRSFDREPAGSESEKIGRKRLCFSKSDRDAIR